MGEARGFKHLTQFIVNVPQNTPANIFTTLPSSITKSQIKAIALISDDGGETNGNTKPISVGDEDVVAGGAATIRPNGVKGYEADFTDVEQSYIDVDEFWCVSAFTGQKLQVIVYGWG